MQVFAKTYTSISLQYSGYIAGTANGILTVQGKPSSRNIYLLDTVTMQLLQLIQSLPNGHYMLLNLNPNKEYIVLARDHKKEFEPFAWDYVKPANDLTVAEQQDLWQMWQ